MRCLILLSGCWLAIQDSSTTPPMVSESGGPCVFWTKAGRGSRHYYVDGESIGAAALEKRLANDPEERPIVLSAGRMRRAGWSLLAIGLTFDVVGWGTFLGLSIDNPKGDLPLWGQAVSGTLIASWFPTMAAGVVLTGEASGQLKEAVDHVNARRQCH
jgi:hypothetical protein